MPMAAAVSGAFSGLRTLRTRKARIADTMRTPIPDAIEAAAVIVAAGKSSRMGGGRNKVLQLLGGRPVLSYSLEVFQKCGRISRIAIVGRQEDRVEISSLIENYCPKAKGGFVPGGAERFDSVRNGLEFFASAAPAAVLIHDAARPFIQERFILDSLEQLNETPGCVIGVPLKDTLKETDANAAVIRTRERTKFWLAQTPQTFLYPIILEAYRQCSPPPYPTDDGEVLEMARGAVKMAEGSYLNMKITAPEDLRLAESILLTLGHPS
ncbi:MAG: 2-C-methyl-D-erythritol 4-phosphate cytidylyltransferase [Candidatus Omnitrophota bacterium]